MTTPSALKIIIIEDEALLQLEYAHAINFAYPSAQIYPLMDSKDLLKTHRQHKADVVITDLVMDSRHEGISGLRELREVDPNVPVIVVSGHPHFAEIAEIFKVSSVFMKPVDMVSVVQSISKCTGVKVETASL